MSKITRLLLRIKLADFRNFLETDYSLKFDPHNGEINI